MHFFSPKNRNNVFSLFACAMASRGPLSRTYTTRPKDEMQARFPHLSAEELREFKDMFLSLDQDGGGSISKDELGELMQTLGIPCKPAELEAIVAEVDEDGSGQIEMSEFIAVMSKRVHIPYSGKEVKAAFKVLQGDAPQGLVRTEDLTHILSTFGGEGLTREQAQELVAQMEPNEATGLVAYAPYVDMMMGEPSKKK
jgi:calmodulin